MYLFLVWIQLLLMFVVLLQLPLLCSLSVSFHQRCSWCGFPACWVHHFQHFAVKVISLQILFMACVDFMAHDMPVSTFPDRGPAQTTPDCGEFKGVRAEMSSLPFLAGDSRIWTSTMASRMAGPISRFHLLPTACVPATATCTLVKPLSCC